jgi:hypothetical protein
VKREDADRADFENTKDVHARARGNALNILSVRSVRVTQWSVANTMMICMLKAMRSGGEGPEGRRCRVQRVHAPAPSNLSKQCKRLQTEMRGDGNRTG